MHVLGCRRALLTWILPLLAFGAGGVEAQLRTVVSNEIAVSSTEAALRLEFDDRESLTVALRDGQVLVNDGVLGSYTRGDALEMAWRSLLGDVISLGDGPLAEALVEWMPPDDLTGGAQELASAIDEALEGALALPEEALADPEEKAAEISITLSDESSVLGALLTRSEALKELGQALEEASLENFTLRIGEDLRVEAGEEIDQSVIVVDGDLEVGGVIRGDVVVTSGSVRLLDGGVITGDLRVVDGEVDSLGGKVEGEVLVPSTADVRSFEAAELEELREELEREIRRDVLSSIDRHPRSSSWNVWNPFRNVGRAIAGLLEDLVTFLVLVVFGVLVVHFARERLEIVATTARRAPAQSAMVGLAGGFLLIPVWILGIVALAVSIIGIPVLLAWVPLFPLAAGAAALLGYIAVARNIGEWVADQEYRGLEWIRGSNTFYVVVAGLGALMVPAVASSLLRILGIGFLTGLLGFLGSAIAFVALAIGFGAVLLTRGGRIRPYAAYYEFEEEELWSESMEGSEPEGSPPPRAEEGETGPGEPGEEDREAATSRPEVGPEEDTKKDEREKEDPHA